MKVARPARQIVHTIWAVRYPASLLLLCVLLPGCYTVRLQSIPLVRTTEIPVSAQIEIPPETAEYTYDVRSWAAGVGNRWRIQVGTALVQYAEAYLTPAVREGQDLIIGITIEDFRVDDFEAHIDARFSVTQGGNMIWSRTYHGNGVGYFAQTAWGGAFAMKSSMRKTTNEALRSVFEQFLANAREHYPQWISVLEPAPQP